MTHRSNDSTSPHDLLASLSRTCTNLLWTWHAPLRRRLAALDPEGWEAAGEDAVRWLSAVPQARIEAWSRDPAARRRIAEAEAALDRYLGAGDTWWARSGAAAAPGPIAYFCAEFGVHASLPIYAGGLGVLAGDHCKSASDLGIPFVAVGLLYREGYFEQSVGADGWQVESYRARRPDSLALAAVADVDGLPLRVPVPLWGRTVHLGIWRADVGRVPLYLLDADVEENLPQDRGLTRHLYGGDLGMRIGQEVLMGIGGLRALFAMGIRPSVTHMNEGHSAFLGLEWMRQERLAGATVDEARAAAASRSVFTTHTPVAAGHDRFPGDLVEHALKVVREEIGLTHGALMGLGRVRPDDGGEPLCMTVLALRLASRFNGVSERHGEVSRGMWRSLWPGVPVEEVPIGSVTNGVHAPTWLGEELQEALDRHLGPRWGRDLEEGRSPLDLSRVSDEEIWTAHGARKAHLVVLARHRVAEQRRRRGAPAGDVEAAASLLSGGLVVGFARRFATYKRADLLFRDFDRVARLLTRPGRPVHLVFAGKAHPKDHPGKEVMARVVAASRDPRLRGHVVFLENYDLALGRALVQGVDVWLNNPRRPKEASGTSGQKAAMNGVPNLSVLDGWWVEGYRPGLGWAIGGIDDGLDDEVADRGDGESLFRMLEEVVVPCYFDRDSAGLPREWIRTMRASIADALPRFNTDRMVAQYATEFYLPVSAAPRSPVAVGTPVGAGEDAA
ncbi:alpha-glucan family phosphorylase [Myxococcota bacterium]|nr:alpha-glucan family phosphorylase [Myxococcota bacterium]